MPSFLNLRVSLSSLSSSPPSTQTKIKTTVVATVAVTAGAVVFFQNRRSRRRRIQRQKECSQKIQLLPNENSFVIKTSPPMNTITFFECSSWEEVETAKVHFQERTRQIVRANPWLQGYLDTDVQDPKGNLALFVPNHDSKSKTPNSSSSSSSFVVLDNLGPLSEDYHTMVKTLDTAMIGNTVEHVASLQETKDGLVWEPLWRVAFIPNTNESTANDNDDDDKKKKPYTFGLVVSGNHSLLDGHGYYKLFNMLSSEEVVQFLNPVRNHDLGDSIRTVTGTEPSFLEEPSLGFILGFVTSTLRNLVFPQTKSIGLVVSNDWIQTQKKEHYQWSIPNGDEDPSDTAPAYVSTNDLLVSEFCQHTHCDLALMAMNLRGRAEGCTDGLMGNYEHLLAYTPEDYASPTSIRKSVTGPVYQRVGASSSSTTSPLPTNLQHVFGCTYAAITNWATFAKELHVQGKLPPSPETVAATSIQQTLHLPLFDFPASTPACTYSSMVVFRPREGAVGILSGGKATLMDALAASPMVGSILYEAKR